MSAIIFDQETKTFSVVEDQREFGKVGDLANKVGGHISKNSRAYITGGSSVAGSIAGGIIAKKRAEKAALAAGATPEEAKKAGKKAAVKGAAAGAAMGAVAGEAGQFGAKALKKVPEYKKGNFGYEKTGKTTRQGAKATFKEMYGDSAKSKLDYLKSKLKKKDK